MTVADPTLAGRAAQLLYTYARAVDEGDIDTLAAIAAEDVQLTRVDGTRSGREAFLDLYRAFRDSNARGSKHVITNVQAFRDGDGLVSIKAYFQATMFEEDGIRVVIGQYADSARDDGDSLVYVHKRIQVERVITLSGSTQEWTGFAGQPRMTA
jgi:3-phenylpropionate/cinnamic acid dioxygenase small subunit